MTQSVEGRVPLLYLAPWVDIGGSDKGTIDWFRFLDRTRFNASLITTQPSANRRLREVAPYADELWELPALMHGDEFPRFILDFIHSRGIQLLHIMNSRVGFELLPDIASLPARPRVVVQLHVEEPHRSGYVRYVTTRYGNLVDAFSVSNQALRKRLGVYDVPIAKRRLIRTGVDADREFSPGRVSPIQGLDPGLFHILFPARLTAQKDPLLMLDVATRLRSRGLAFQIHVLGDGELTSAVRDRRTALGLQHEVILHGSCVEIAPWYAACDAVLLTSAFEGMPYAIYEAMAMAVPGVVPDLPGLSELVWPEIGVLVRPRDDPEAYAAAISALASDPTARRQMGDVARSRAQAEFSLRVMADEHRALYDELLAARPKAGRACPTPPGGRNETSSVPTAFLSRRPGATPLVSIIVPCFNHGRYLPACLRSVRSQTYDPIETIVVDDGSTDAETLDVLSEIERDGAATVLRLPLNRGPSAARNAGIERSAGRYVLPLDADNLLLPSAVADLVQQLASAGERIGFIYPNLQFFGNRGDQLEAPSYNLHALLDSSYCDSSSLIDREVFDRGFRFPEDIVLGHEDWDFALSLAECRIYGEPARAKTLLYRKRGFTRSDLVESTIPFGEVVAARHPSLFANRAVIKGEWNPALTLIALDPLTEGSQLPPRLVAAAERQTCPDYELIVRTGEELPTTMLGRRLRRVPSALAGSRAEALAQCVTMSRGRYALAAYGSPLELLADPALIEKTLRILRANSDLDALALADSGAGPRPLGLLDSSEASGAALGALCWKLVGAAAPPAALSLAGDRPLEGLACWLGVHATVQWRHYPRGAIALPGGPVGRPRTAVGAPWHVRRRDVRLRDASPALPGAAPAFPPRLAASTFWRPTQTRLLCRHRHLTSGRYVYTAEQAPPKGCVLDYVLGCLRSYPLPGTQPLLRREGEPAFALGPSAEPDDPALLGFFEQAALPMFDELTAGRHTETGQQLLLSGPSDPLADRVDESRALGWIESYPMQPRFPPHSAVTCGLVGLVRTVDLGARRHRYGAGRVPPGRVAGELGALFAESVGECEPLWIDEDGHVFVATDALSEHRPSLRTALRWTGDPLTWRRFSRTGPKVRASARRALDSARVLTKSSVSPDRPSRPAGYLLRSPTGRTVALHAAIHPVTGDQLLSTDRAEAVNLGYRDPALLGHLVAEAPVTGKLGPTRPAAPWADRFGLMSSAHG